MGQTEDNSFPPPAGIPLSPREGANVSFSSPSYFKFHSFCDILSLLKHFFLGEQSPGR